jgi:hypothetical protein
MALAALATGLRHFGERAGAPPFHQRWWRSTALPSAMVEEHPALEVGVMEARRVWRQTRHRLQEHKRPLRSKLVGLKVHRVRAATSVDTESHQARISGSKPLPATVEREDSEFVWTVVSSRWMAGEVRRFALEDNSRRPKEHRFRVTGCVHGHSWDPRTSWVRTGRVCSVVIVPLL